MLMHAVSICFDCEKLGLRLTAYSRRHAPCDCPLFSTYKALSACPDRKEWDATKTAFKVRYGVKFPLLHEPRKSWLSTR
jgi:hypothetical protein